MEQAEDSGRRAAHEAASLLKVDNSYAATAEREAAIDPAVFE